MSPVIPRHWMERLVREPQRQDPYRSKSKPRGTPQCSECGSVSIRGSWVPLKAAMDKSPPRLILKGALKCPACRQLEDRYAMGVIELRGDSWKTKQDAILKTIQKTEKIARLKNDQQRILWSKPFRGYFKIYVSLPELAKHIGRELERTFKGVTEYERSSEEPYIRVRWWSDLPHQGQEPGAPLAIKRKSRLSIKSKSSRPKSKSFRNRG